jgi:hypothetical protein
VAVDASELVARLDHPGRAPAQRHLPVTPPLDPSFITGSGFDGQ